MTTTSYETSADLAPTFSITCVMVSGPRCEHLWRKIKVMTFEQKLFSVKAYFWLYILYILYIKLHGPPLKIRKSTESHFDRAVDFFGYHSF